MTQLIAVCGIPGSGKTTIANQLNEMLNDPTIKHQSLSEFEISQVENQQTAGSGAMAGVPVSQVLSQDNFYRGLGDAAPEDYNFDETNALNLEQMYQSLLRIKEVSYPVTIPTYDFYIHEPSGFVDLHPSQKMIVEGHLFLLEKKIYDLIDYLVFVDIDWDIAFARRLQRDVKQRGRDIEDVIHRFFDHARPHFIEIETFREKANCVIDNRASMQTELDAIHSQSQFAQVMLKATQNNIEQSTEH